MNVYTGTYIDLVRERTAGRHQTGSTDKRHGGPPAGPAASRNPSPRDDQQVRGEGPTSLSVPSPCTCRTQTGPVTSPTRQKEIDEAKETTNACQVELTKIHLTTSRMSTCRKGLR